MRIYKDQFQLSASDLAKHLACRHLTFLDLAAARGELRRPVLIDPYVVALEQRGLLHEGEYLNHLRDSGLEVLRRGEHLAEEGVLDRTIAAMKRGIPVIAQADLNDGQWRGRADVLLRVERPGGLGEWSYEVVDTKLAQETKGGTILQLCLYSELVAKIQGLMPEFMHVVSPGNNFQPESFRLQDYLAYYRYVKRRLEKEVSMGEATEVSPPDKSGKPLQMSQLQPPPDPLLHKEGEALRATPIHKEGEPRRATPIHTYPEPVEYCELCDWWTQCNERRRLDDHLSFVAGISRLQIGELRKRDVHTLANLAEMPIPLKQKPDRGSLETYERIREQARLQLQRRNTGNPIHELLALEPECGLARLPEPSAGDIFLDFESDPFVPDGGLEYLVGYVTVEDAGETSTPQYTAGETPAPPQYTALWALHRSRERRAFETFIDFVMNRIQLFPDLHIYHFSPYEPSALKRLMGRYASREDEIDQLLRELRFVDLYAIVKQSLRASVEKYSLKDLELFFGFQRQIDLKDVRKHKSILECALELNDIYSIPKEAQQIVEDYNRDDCISTLRLRNWLESIREEQVRAGKEIPRPPLEPGEPSEEVDENRKLVLALMDRLLQDVPEDPAARSPEEHARWLLAHMLEYHRREEKVLWWEYFRLKELTDEELLDQRYAISGLQFVARVGHTKKCAIDRYRFPPQDLEVRKGDELETSTGPFGDVETMDIPKGIVDVKKRMAMTDVHPGSVFVHKIIRTKIQKAALLRIGTWVAENSVDGAGKYRAGRDLLLRKSGVQSPEFGGEEGTPDPGLRTDEKAIQAVLQLDHGVLPIQGPPGAGKTYTGARMICALLRTGKKVGITAVSHKVIRKLCEEVVKAAHEQNLTVHGIQKVSEVSAAPNPSIAETKDNAEVLAALNNGEAQFGAGTAWMWARPEFAEGVDVLFVDEAGQMSLPEVIAVSQAAKSIVMLGDPQQLEQPLQGTHPPGVAESALQHILGDHKTMPPESGLFLGETWRLSPAICQFTSEIFYENRLKSRDGCEIQRLTGSSRFAGSGLFYVPVSHEGNQNSSGEEVDAVVKIVRELLGGNTRGTGVSPAELNKLPHSADETSAPPCFWVDSKGESHRLELKDILIVAPYNAQVFELAKRLPDGSRIGTVDKFQGQEAPVVIYSMTTSSPEEAPHGMEFLYSLNRFNVATSRAKCACILVASPRLFEPECKSPHQMKLANVLCRYLELAR